MKRSSDGVEKADPLLIVSERVRVAVMLQSWCDLTFLHWRYPPEVVQRLVPPPLEVETFDGSAWVGVTPFMLRDLRPMRLPPLPWFSHFPETNCRTYVKGPGGQSGVWFFSLEGARAIAAIGARLAYGLPYAWARMRVDRTATQLSYRSARLWPNSSGRTNIIVAPGEPVRTRPLDVFLTARYRLYSFILGRLTYTSVEHAPWPLQAARLIRVDQTLTAAAGLPDPEAEPIAHFSSGVRVRVARPKMA